MSFETLNNRLGGVPPVAQPIVQPAPQVYPIENIVKQGVDGVENIIKTFDPLSKAEREAKIAHNAVILHAYQLGQQGNGQGMQDLLQYANGSFDKWKDGIQKSTIAKNRATAYRAMRPVKKETAPSHFLDTINKARADAARLSAAKNTPPQAQAPSFASAASIFNPSAAPQFPPTPDQTNIPDTSLE